MNSLASRPTRVDPLRALGVTLGLTAGGAVFGATAGAVGLGLVAILSAEIPDPGVLFIAGAVGAVLGTMLTPIAAWLLLRCVPLGRLFAGAVVGTVVGGVLGWFAAPGRFIPVENAVYGAIGGFFVAAVVMWRTSRGRREGLPPPV